MKVTGNDNPAYDFSKPAYCLADVLDHFDFNIGNIVKACFRLQAAKDGKGKNPEKYELDKISYYLQRVRGMSPEVCTSLRDSAAFKKGLQESAERAEALMGLQRMPSQEQGEET